MRRRSHHRAHLLGLLAMLFGLSRVATSQRVPSCPRPDDIGIRQVAIVGTQRGSAQHLPADTLWVPSEGRFGDAVYVRVSPIVATSRSGDSIYAAATIQLMLRAATAPGAATQDLVPFPIRTVRDTIVALTPGESVTLGPFSTNDLIPWPGIAVEATANSLPIGVVAVAWILRTRRSTPPTCTEPLKNNVRRSRLVTLDFAY
jgi:hypothetical protein